MGFNRFVLEIDISGCIEVNKTKSDNTISNNNNKNDEKLIFK